MPNDLVVMNEVAQDASYYFSIDEPKSLKSILVNLSKNKSHLQEMSNSCVIRSANYIIDIHVNKLINLYQ